MLNWIRERIKRNSFRFNKNATRVIHFDVYKLPSKFSINHISCSPYNYKFIDINLLDECFNSSSNIYRYFKNYLDTGKIGLAAFDGEKIISYGWLSIKTRENKEFVNTIFYQPKNSGYIFSCKTEYFYRGKGLYKSILVKLVEYCTKLGVERIYIDTERNNFNAKRGIERLGFKKVGKIIKLSILGFRIIQKQKYDEVNL